VLAALQTRDGALRRSTTLLGSFGIPMITYDIAAGLSHDGRTLVVGNPDLAPTSRILVLDARTLRLRNWLVLKGSFAFDALSPDGSRLYLIQHTLAADGDYAHYVVRAYDLRAHALLPGRVADRTQTGWVMDGYPLDRVTSGDGRWVYTLYQNGGDGFPFVHALDTVRGIAHCIGLPLRNESGIYNLRLSLRGGGRSLAVHWRSGRPWLAIDTVTWRISYPRGGTASWTIGAAAGGSAAILAVAAGALLVRRRRREEVDEQPRDDFRLSERQVVV
jgi:hypothetical protein